MKMRRLRSRTLRCDYFARMQNISSEECPSLPFICLFDLNRVQHTSCSNFVYRGSFNNDDFSFRNFVTNAQVLENL